MAEGGNGGDTNGQGLTTLGSESVIDFYCEVCRDDGSTIEADGFCVDCDEYLCDACLKAHKRLRPMRHHKLLDKTQMPQDAPLSEDRCSKEITTMCSIHSGKPVEYYCQSHDIFGCAPCFVPGHKSCDGVECIKEKSENLFDGDQCKTFFENLTSLQQKAHEVTETVRESASQTKQYCSEAVRAVKEFRKEIDTILDGVEEHFIEQAGTIASEETEKLEVLDRELCTISQQISKLSAEANQLQASRRSCQLYIKMIETSSEISSLRKSLDSIGNNDVSKSFTFQPSAQLKDNLANNDTFGKMPVHVHRSDTFVSDDDSECQSDGKMPVHDDSESDEGFGLFD